MSILADCQAVEVRSVSVPALTRYPEVKPQDGDVVPREVRLPEICADTSSAPVRSNPPRVTSSNTASSRSACAGPSRAQAILKLRTFTETVNSNRIGRPSPRPDSDSPTVVSRTRRALWDRSA